MLASVRLRKMYLDAVSSAPSPRIAGLDLQAMVADAVALQDEIG